MSILITLLILSLIILVHELGHFFACRKTGVLVEEFAMGLGPVLWSVKPKETKYSLRLFPIGGFCKMSGEDITEADADILTAENSFFAKSIPKRVIVLMAGSLMNFALAFVILFVVFMLNGFIAPVIEEILPGFPAEAAGLMPGDRIIKINDYRVYINDDLSFALNDVKDEVFDVTVRRGGKRITVTARMETDTETNRKLLGIVRKSKTGLFGEDSINIFEGLYQAFFQIVSIVRTTCVMLIRMLHTGFSADAFAGPVGLAAMVGEVYNETAAISPFAVIVTMAGVLAFISVSIGMVNLFPLPALDGGRLIFIFIEALTKKRVPPEKEAIVHLAGFVIFIILAALIAVKDYRTFY